MRAWLLVLALAAGARGDDDGARADLAAFEARILAELSAQAPGALVDARAAGEAYAAGRWQEAIDGYRRVLALAPGYSHAQRRICNAQGALGAHAEAVASCRAALASARLPENQVALARALVASSPGPDARSEATRLARQGLAALAVKPDRSLAGSVCEVAMKSGDLALLRAGVQALRVAAPSSPEAHAFAAIVAASDGDYGEARAEVGAARAAGLDPAAADALDRGIDQGEPAAGRWARRALWVVLGWVAGLVLLLAAGAALSLATLRAAGRLARTATGTGSTGSRVLRHVYGAVLWATCAYYYASIPLVLLAVLALGGGLVWACFAVGQVPVKLVLIVGLVALATVWAVLKSLWAVVRPGGREDPGDRVRRGDHPALDRLVREVAARVGTRPVDAVFLTPGTDLAVFERGGLARQLAGRAERCLILGAGVLDGLTQGELKAVLAHEYGHLVNRDTASGGFALTVRRSVLTMGRALAAGGAATWYNPAWWFVRGFYKVFLRVSQGASRLQEILADRWSALAYGGRTFGQGLAHVIAQSVRFDRHVQRTLGEVIEAKRPLVNLYRYAPARSEEPSALEAAVAQALDAAPSPYDSHPCPRDRISWTAGIAGTTPAGIDDGAPAWALFADREAVEATMTDRIRAAVAENHGITIPA